jgi:large subunit ribosomal protein L29
VPSAIELRELDDDELEARLAEYRRELLNLRFQLATGQLDNVSRMSVVRKDVARVLTVLRDREIAAAEGRYAGPVVSDRLLRRRELEDEDEEEPAAPRSRRASARAAAGSTDELEDEELEDDDVGVDDVADDDVEGFDDAVAEDDDDVEAPEEDQ